mmetsp:Transcript_6560/g.10544  ORF Transcript_6560/g.10544 Transcript_6560/m.10544 type:complete len:511 (-) Transcript_6560:63-1595(-)
MQHPTDRKALTQLIEVAGIELRNELKECAGIVLLKDALHAVCSDGGNDPSSVMSSIDTIFRNMREIITHVRDNPNNLPAPDSCRLPGETTIRARFGLRAASEMFSNGIIEKLEAFSRECDDLWCSVKQIHGSCQEILNTLRTCSDCVSRNYAELSSLDKSIEVAILSSVRCADDQAKARVHAKMADVYESCGMMVVQECIVKLAALPWDLRQLLAASAQIVGKIQEFSRKAPEEMRMAFLLPFPANRLQSILVGEDPPTKKMLLARLYALGSLDVQQIVARLQNLTEALANLPLKLAEDSLRKFSAKSLERLKVFDRDVSVLDKDSDLQVIGQRLSVGSENQIEQSKELLSTFDQRDLSIECDHNSPHRYVMRDGSEDSELGKESRKCAVAHSDETLETETRLDERNSPSRAEDCDSADKNENTDSIAISCGEFSKGHENTDSTMVPVGELASVSNASCEDHFDEDQLLQRKDPCCEDGQPSNVARSIREEEQTLRDACPETSIGVGNGI